jgi:hypothetical protein
MGKAAFFFAPSRLRAFALKSFNLTAWIRLRRAAESREVRGVNAGIRDNDHAKR